MQLRPVETNIINIMIGLVKIKCKIDNTVHKMIGMLNW